MKQSTKFLHGLLVIFVAGCVATPTLAPAPINTVIVVATPAPPTSILPAFAFPKGATWIYEGIVKWDDKPKPQQKTLTWKMQIADKLERGDGMVAYVMQGHPLDLAFYDAAKKPSDYLYIAQANRVYQITLMDAQPIERVKNKNDALTDLLTDENLVYDFPLIANKKFGSAQFARQGEMNVWIVAEAKPTTLTGIKGIAPPNATEYTLNFNTNPDRQAVYFVPGIGITRYVYHHNGTLSDVDVKLIEYNSPTK